MNEETKVDGEETVVTTDTETEDQTATGADTETETADADTDTETATEEQGLFVELGLNKTYKTPDDALRAVRHKESELERLRQEKQQLLGIIAGASKKEEAKEEKPKVDAEAFREEFGFELDAFKKMAKVAGFVSKDEIEPKLRAVEQESTTAAVQVAKNNLIGVLSTIPALESVKQDFLAGKPVDEVGVDNELWEEMNHIAAANPIFRAWTTIDKVYQVVPTLQALAETNLAKRKPADKPKPKVVVDSSTKASANTAGGVRKPAAEPKQPDYSGWSAEKIMDDMRKRGLVT